MNPNWMATTLRSVVDTTSDEIAIVFKKSLRMSFLRGVLLASFLPGLLTLCCYSQSEGPMPPVPSAANRWNSVENHQFDSIDLGTLDVILNIPIFSKTQRGGPFEVAYKFDNQAAWQILPNATRPNVYFWNSAQAWSSGADLLTGYVTYNKTAYQCNDNQGTLPILYDHIFDGFVYHDKYGEGHPFPGVTVTTGTNCLGPSHVGLPAASGGYTLSAKDSTSLPSLVRMPNASTADVPMHGPSYIDDFDATFTDENGNYTQIQESVGSGTFTNFSLTDNLGINSLTSVEVDDASGRTLSRTYSYTDSNGTSQQVKVAYTVYNVASAFSCGPHLGYELDDFSIQRSLVTRITLPDLTFYGFTYEATPGVTGKVTGRISKLTLPTGGTISYGYPGTNSGMSCFDGTTTSLTRTTADGTTTYSRTAPDPHHTSHTDLSDAAGDATGIDFLWRSQGYLPVLTTTPLGQVRKCYNGVSAPCPSQTASAVQQINSVDTYSTVDGALVGHTKEILGLAFWPLDTEIDEYADPSSSIPTRKTIKTYFVLNGTQTDKLLTQTVTNGSDVLLAKTTYGYDDYALASTSGIPGHNAPPTSIVGNLTSQYTWVDTAGTTLASHWKYDDTGQVIAAQDPRLNWTSFGYDSGTDSCKISTTPPKPSSGVSQATSATCDYNTGLVTSTTDANGVKTSYTFDSMFRLTGTSTKAAGTVVASMTRSYGGSTLPKVLKTTITATPNPSEVSLVTLDGLGRTVKTTTPSGAMVDTTYNSLGYVQSVSNPYLTTGDATYGITSYSYDALGRKRYQCQPGNTSVNTTTCAPANSYLSWTYAGYTVTSQDEVANQRQQWTDGLGRLTKVLEPNGVSKSPSMETDYSYDPLGNLTGIKQWGGPTSSSDTRTRSFTYNFLSQLVQTFNPETGWVCYGTTPSNAPANGTNCTSGYDPNGNLTAKTDARGITTTYTYDALNRLTQKSYSNGEGPVRFGYDIPSVGFVTVPSNPAFNVTATIANPIGRMAWQCRESAAQDSCVTMDAFSYDPMGRVVQKWSSTPAAVHAGAPVYISQHHYDLAGNRTSMTNSTGRTFNYTYDAAGRLLTASHTVSLAGTPATTPMVTGMTYFASGQPHTMTTNTGSATITGTWGVDNRQRVTSYQNLSTANSANTNYGYSLTYTLNNNVNTDAETVYQPGVGAKSWSWIFNYDTLDRLANSKSAGAIQYGCQETYDPFGNRTAQAPYGGTGYSCTSPTTPVVPGSNRLSGYSYDAAGNLLNDGINTLTYDAEGRIATSISVSNGTTSYTYGADGQRVSKTVGAVETDYVRDLDSVLLDTYVSGSYINQPQEMWVGGRHYGTVYAYLNNGVLDQTEGLSLTNWLGSEAMRSFSVSSTGDNTGIPTYAFLSQPFGDAQTTLIGSDHDDIHFTGKERDAESGNDYFGARYYASGTGRFMSPDWSGVPDTVPYADFRDPQSLNLYAYAGNNPLANEDGDGHVYRICDAKGQNCSPLDDETFETDEARDRMNGEQFSGGQIFHMDGDTKVIDGTYSWQGPDLPGDAASNQAAANMIGNGGMAMVNMFMRNMAYTVGGGLIGRGIGLGIEAIADGAGQAINTGTNVVYRSLNASGDVQYVGITNDLARRAGEHAGRFAIEEIPGLSSLSRADAKAVEQVLIETHGLGTNGGALLNKINSIASTNPAYAQAIQRGAQILQQIGYFK